MTFGHGAEIQSDNSLVPVNDLNRCYATQNHNVSNYRVNNLLI